MNEKCINNAITGIYCSSIASGAGIWQWYVETHSLSSVKPGPFSFPEEFLEGSIPAFLGGLALLSLVRKVSSSSNLGPDEVRLLEMVSYSVGALSGYIAMMIGGEILHSAFGVPDIKWGPFK